MKTHSPYLFTLSKKLTQLAAITAVVSFTSITFANAETVDSAENVESVESVESDDVTNNTDKLSSENKLANEKTVTEEKEILLDNKIFELEQQYALLMNADADFNEIYKLVNQLNQILDDNPDKANAWTLLAEIYYDYGYYDYALYAANEAVSRGVNLDYIDYIILGSSLFVAENQLDNDYLNQITDKAFIYEYQTLLSKINGKVHNLNYDETRPKPVVYKTKGKPTKIRKPRKPFRPKTKKPTSVYKPKRIVPPKVKQTPKVTRRVPKKSKPLDPFRSVR